MKFFHPFVNSMMNMHRQSGFCSCFSLSYSPSLWAQTPEAEPRQLELGTIDEAVYNHTSLFATLETKALGLAGTNPQRIYHLGWTKIIPAGDTVHLRFTAFVQPKLEDLLNASTSIIMVVSRHIPSRWKVNCVMCFQRFSCCGDFNPKTNGRALAEQSFH